MTKDVTQFHDVMQLLDRGATEQEIIDAAAALAVPPGNRQGSLL